MDCKQCGTVLEGRQREYCSDKCRKRASRTKPMPEDAPQSTNADTMVVERGQSERGQPTRTAGDAEHHDACLCVQAMVAGPGTLEHYLASPDKYIPRREPDKLNWGPWMDSHQLEQAGLKGNRVAIPGDWDYAGVAQEAVA